MFKLDRNKIIGGIILVVLFILYLYFTTSAPVTTAAVTTPPSPVTTPPSPVTTPPSPVTTVATGGSFSTDTAPPSPVTTFATGGSFSTDIPVLPSSPSPVTNMPVQGPAPIPTPTPAPSVSPIYSDWTAWSSCKLPQGANCGSGIRSRTRRCISGNCGELSQTLECNVECTAPSTRLSSMSFYINSNKWEYLRPITNEIVELDFKVEDMKVILKDGTSTLIEGIENIVWVEENNELKMKSPDNREFIVIRKKNEDLEIDLIPVSIKMLIYKKGRLIDNWYCNDESYPVRYRNGQLECIGTEGQRCFPQDPDICPSFVNRLNTELQYNKDMFDPNMYAQKVRLYSELTST